MIGHINDIPARQLLSDSVKNAAMKVLVSPETGWSDHVMRLVELGCEGYSPEHSHPWPHINFVVAGEGELMIEGTIHPLMAGTYAFIPANTLHQFRNPKSAKLSFICIVPKEGHQ